MSQSEIEIDCSCSDILNVLERQDMRRDVLQESRSSLPLQLFTGSQDSIATPKPPPKRKIHPFKTPVIPEMIKAAYT